MILFPKRYEWSIAWRYLRARRTKSLSMVTWLAIGGVALGVCALVGGFSVTTGFESAFREKVLGITAHVFVREYGIRFRSYPLVESQIARTKGVKATSPMTFSEALVAGPEGNTGVVVKGVTPGKVSRVLDLDRYMTSGALKDLERPAQDGVEGVIIGAALADELGVKQGDFVTLVSPLRSPDPGEWKAQARAPQTGNFEVRGIFDAGFQEYDTRLAYMELSVAQSFFGLGDVATGIEVAVDDPLDSGRISEAIRVTLAGGYSVADWRVQNRNLFKSLSYQRLAILVVLSVMVVLASCLVACTLIMMVIDRRREIAILKAMGFGDTGILRIFVLQGVFIGIVGTVLGLGAGFALCEGLLSNGIALDPQVYGIARLPVIFDPLDYLMAAVGALVITGFASVFPALRGARLKPVDGLRPEPG